MKTPQRLVVFLAVMMMLLGVTTYVVMQDNGIYEREIKPMLEKSASTNEVVEK